MIIKKNEMSVNALNSRLDRAAGHDSIIWINSDGASLKSRGHSWKGLAPLQLKTTELQLSDIILLVSTARDSLTIVLGENYGTHLH